MKVRITNLFCLLGLFIFAPLVTAQGDEIFLCDVDISDRASPYHWQFIEPRIPMYLYPDHAEIFYQQLLEEYTKNLAPDDEQRDEVKEFIKLQKAIISKQTTAFLSMKPNIDGVFEITSINMGFPIDCDDVRQTYLIDIRYLSIAFRKIHDISLEVFRAAADQTIQGLNRQYQNWFDNGLPMWPQETWFNGLFLGESDTQKPAEHQWVIFRPSVGLGVNSSEGISGGNVDESLGIEIGGFVRYLNDDYSNYWGLSVLATLGEDAGVGYGLLLRYDDYVFGYTRRDRDASLGIGSDNRYFYIGYDLYKLVHDRKDKFNAYRQKIRETIAEF